MKLVVNWVGDGNNERALAQMISKGGARVVFLQRGLRKRIDIWEQGDKIHSGREKSVGRWRMLDDFLAGQPSGFQMLLRTLAITKGQRIDLMILESNRATFGLLLRRFGLAKRLVIVLTDYLPETGSRAICWHRRIVNRLLNCLAARVDEVWTVSPRIPAAQLNPGHFIMPIFIDPATDSKDANRTEITYIGFPSADHALEILFELARKHGWKLNIIGESIYLRGIAHLAPEDAVFHGLITDRDRIAKIMQNSFCGYAVYNNLGPTGYSYFGVPSKLFYYFSNNVPVITTNTSHFSAQVREHKLGHLVEPEKGQIEAAILELSRGYPQAKEAIVAFRKQWDAGVEEFLRERMAHLLGVDNTGQG